jgi:hypothetical protein
MFSLHCIILEYELFSSIDDKTTIICTHHKNVENYNNLIFQRLFLSNEAFDVVLNSASKFQHMQHWIKDAHFEHIKELQLEFWFS